MTYEEFRNALFALKQDDLKALVERRHPYYDTLEPHWGFVQSTYEGGREWFDDNLFQFYKEGDGEFEDRLERAYRPNHTREVVDLVNKYIFKSPIARRTDDAPQFLKDFWKATTLNRKGIDDYMRLISQRSSVVGKLWVVVDSKAPAGKIVSKADEREAGARVYSYTVKPEDALDMAFDEVGNLTWFLLRETRRDDDLFSGSGDVVPQYRIWTPNFWALITQTKKGGKTIYKVDSTFAHNLGAVPVFAADHVIGENMYWTPGLVDDSAYMDRAVANYLSNIDVIIQDQTFSQLVIPAQALMPGDEGEDKVLEMSTKRSFTYDAQAGVAPTYISPDPRQASLILSIINKLVAEIYQTVGMSGERTKQDNAAGIDNSSGVAKAYDFERMNAMLAAKAASLQAVENNLIALVRLYNSEGNPDTVFTDDATTSLVNYPENFDVRSLYDEFEIASNLAMVVAPDKVRQEQMKTLIDKLFPGLSKTLIAEIKASVGTNWPPPLLMPTAKPTPPLLKGNPTPKGPNGTGSKQGQNNKDA